MIPWKIINEHKLPDEVPVDTLIRVLESGEVTLSKIQSLPGFGPKAAEQLRQFLGLELKSKSTRRRTTTE